MRDLMFATVWLVALPLSVVSANSGLLLWIWVALLSPGELLYGFMAGVQFNKMVALTTFGAVVFSKDKKDFYLDFPLFMTLMLGVVATLSWQTALVATDDGTDLWEKLIKVLVLAFLITGISTTRHRIHLVVLAVVTALAFLGVKEGLIALLTAGGHHIIGTGSVGDNNSLATALLMIVPMTYYLARYSALRMIRLGMLTVLVLSIVTVVMTYSRGGFIGLLVVAVMMIKNSRRKLPGIAMVLLGAVLVYSFAPETWFQRLGTIETAADDDGSFLGRVIAWKISTVIALAHPLLGGGPHAVQRFAVWTQYAPQIGMFNFFPTPPPDLVPHAAHSTYFEILGDLGFTGLFTFMSIMLASFWQMFRIRRMTKGRPDLLWANELASMLQISLVVYAVTTALLSMGYFEMYWILIALISRCHRTVRQALAATAATEGVAAPAMRGRFVPGPLARPAGRPAIAARDGRVRPV